MHIGLTQQNGKLVFVASLQVSCHCETSAHTGRGNPPAPWNQVTITTKNRRNPHFLGAYRYISPLTGGLPRQCAHWLAMTAIIRQTPIQVIGFNKQIVKSEFVGFVPPIVGRGYDPAAHVPMREMYVLP